LEDEGARDMFSEKGDPKGEHEGVGMELE